MAELVIPEEHYSKFKEFIKLSSDDKNKLFDSLNSAKDLNTEYLADYISNKIPNLNYDKISNIILLYKNLTNARNTIGLPFDEFITSLIHKLVEVNILESSPDQKNFDEFYKFLSSGKQLIEKVEVFNLMTQNSCNFIDTKLNQDIRPYFNESGVLVGSTIINTLKIKTIQNNEVKDIYISMDTNDVTNLLDELKKAQIKIKLIHDNFNNAKIIEP